MAQFCSACGAQIPEGSTACPSCKRPVAQSAGSGAAAAPAASGGLDNNVAGLLAYLFIPAIIFLVAEPYNKNRFVRFHSFQSLFFAGFNFALGIALSILMMIPVLGLLIWLASIIVWIGLLIVWIVLLVKAYQNQMFKLPVIGEMAEKQAGNL
jgi:uncharacterized membrane protein